MPCRMLGLVAMQLGGLVRLVGHSRLFLVVVDHVERQRHHFEPSLAVFLRPVVAGRGQMLKQGVYDRV
jgi:hypothetical protein